jgi:branched-chain amino acid transport system permease protein
MKPDSKNSRGTKELLIKWAPFIVLGLVSMAIPVTGLWFQSMVAKAIIYGLFAMSLNLLWGYTGLWSLGHAAYFGAGGYTAGILATHYNIDNLWLVALAGIVVGALISAMFGIVALRARGVYFLLITLALSQVLYIAAIKGGKLTLGYSGIVGLQLPKLGLGGHLTDLSLYFVIVLISFACFTLMHRIINSPFGRALQGIRDDERRMDHLGYNTWLYKYIAFIVAGAFAALAGVLNTYLYLSVSPNNVSITTSVLAMLMVIIGSDRRIFGPILGAFIVVFLEHFIGVYSPARWPLILGGIFVIVVIFLRRGIGIYLAMLWGKLRARYEYGSGQD